MYAYNYELHVNQTRNDSSSWLSCCFNACFLNNNFQQTKDIACTFFFLWLWSYSLEKYKSQRYIYYLTLICVIKPTIITLLISNMENSTDTTANKITTSPPPKPTRSRRTKHGQSSTQSNNDDQEHHSPIYTHDNAVCLVIDIWMCSICFFNHSPIVLFYIRNWDMCCIKYWLQVMLVVKEGSCFRRCVCFLCMIYVSAINGNMLLFFIETLERGGGKFSKN